MKNYTAAIKIIILAVVLAAGVSYISAWTGPSVAAPGGNAAAPINASSSAQTKYGPLVINFNNALSPGLEVLGPIQIVDGTQATGSVLVSNGVGVSHWAAASTLVGGSGSAYSNITEFQTSSTWTAPAGVTKIRVRAWGAGGGGGGSSGYAGSGGGGGSGAYAEGLVTVVPGTTYTITVGTGGPGGVTDSSNNAFNGSNGGSSSFGTAVVAGGGIGGFADRTGSFGGDGGTATAGNILWPGASGQDALDNGSMGGVGASAPGGGAGGISSSHGTPGGFPGGGGGGSGNLGGGATGIDPLGYGGRGDVIVEY